MFGAGAGWGIPASSPTALMLTVGGIGEKQVVVDGKSSIRECLSLTISVDHDLVDGAPAARFAQRLKELVESGYGLDLNNRVVATV
jgi:pyruvate/2-oxoglutarate dehydrogenase complex dihydrolipoamide acyltransferase (E2) component